MSLSLLIAAFLFAPVFVIFLSFVPAPIVWLSYRRGPALGAVAAALCSGLVLGLAGVSGIPFAAVFFLGVVQATMLIGNHPASRVLTVSILFMAAAVGGIFGLTYLLEGPTLAAAQKDLLKYMLQLRTTLGGEGLTRDEVVKTVAAAVRAVPYVLPGSAAVAAAAMGVLSYSAGKLTLGAEALKLPRLSPFVQWRLPWYFAWGYLLGLAGALFFQYAGRQSVVVRMAGSNMLILFGTLFAVQGFAIIFFWLGKYRVRTLWRAFLFTMIVLVPLLLEGVSLLGLMDTWFDLRRLEQPAGTGPGQPA